MTTRTISRTSSIAQRIAVALALIMVGSTLVYGTGFAQDARLHNAAHDTRHSLGFPCH